jgi:hypothetical protein
MMSVGMLRPEINAQWRAAWRARCRRGVVPLPWGSEFWQSTRVARGALFVKSQPPSCELCEWFHYSSAHVCLHIFSPAY